MFIRPLTLNRKKGKRRRARPDKDALEGKAARVAALSHGVQVALAVAAGRVGEPLAKGSQARQLQQLRGRRLHRAQQRVRHVAGWLAGRLLAPEPDPQRRQASVLAQHAHALVPCPQPRHSIKPLCQPDSVPGFHCFRLSGNARPSRWHKKVADFSPMKPHR